MGSTIRIANAPCSWGALEFEGMVGDVIGYRQMLDELRDTGYTGTELGDWGFVNDLDAIHTIRYDGIREFVDSNSRWW